MRTHRWTMGMLALAAAALAAAPAPAEAQQDVTVRRTPVAGTWAMPGRGFIGLSVLGVPEGDPSPRRLAIMEVVPNSPAANAGLAAGDTLVRINGAAATTQLLTAFSPGDTVALRVRRAGRERNVNVVAAERPAAMSIRALQLDSINDRVLNIMGSMRIDTTAFPRFEWRRIEGDSVMTVIIGRDTIRAARVGPGGATFYGRGVPPDSVFGRAMPRGDLHVFGDSARRFEILRPGDLSQVYRFGAGDSAFARPFDVMASSFSIRAVAGAELAELNPELSQYFGAVDGVLVLNARDGTPAERAGLRGGDIIVQVNGTAVRSITELRRAIDTRSGQTQLRVLRRGQQVDVTLPR